MHISFEAMLNKQLLFWLSIRYALHLIRSHTSSHAVPPNRRTTSAESEKGHAASLLAESVLLRLWFLSSFLQHLFFTIRISDTKQHSRGVYHTLDASCWELNEESSVPASAKAHNYTIVYDAMLCYAMWYDTIRDYTHTSLSNMYIYICTYVYT